MLEGISQFSQSPAANLEIREELLVVCRVILRNSSIDKDEGGAENNLYDQNIGPAERVLGFIPTDQLGNLQGRSNTHIACMGGSRPDQRERLNVVLCHKWSMQYNHEIRIDQTMLDKSVPHPKLYVQRAR